MEPEQVKPPEQIPAASPGSLTPEQKTQVVEWLDEKFQAKTKGYPKCDMCGTNSWSLQGHTVTPLIFSRGGLSIGGGAYPLVMMSCVHCGNTKFFSAIQMGVIKKDGGTDGK